MFRGMFYDLLSILWIILILFYFYIASVNIKKYRKLGRLILQNRRKFNTNLLLAIIFIIIAAQNLISYFNYREIYSIITSTGMLVGAIAMVIKGIRKPQIYENGIITLDAIIMCENIIGYKWINRESNCNRDLLLLANYKVLFTNQYNKKFHFTINKEDIKTIQTFLDTKGINEI